ncbi:hypothetical protein ACS0TY_005893 [Phlomoides rotata]
MALLASCWLITESFIIPDGFIKWFYLSFYIHPFFLVFCQIFLWLKVWLMWFCFPFKIVLLFVFKFIKRVLIFLFSFIRTVDDQVYYDVLEPADHLQQISLQDCEIVVSCNKTGVQVQPGVSCWIDGSEDVIIDSYPSEEINDHKNSVQDSWLNQYLYSDHFCILSSMSKYDTDTDTDTDTDVDTGIGIDIEFDKSEFVQESEDVLSISKEHDSFSPISTDDSNTLDDRQMNIRAIKDDDDIDPFHQKYTSRMRFFNLLYHERLHGMKVILNEHLTTIGIEFIMWNPTEKKRILKSLEYDLEMICVAQSCLLWEALHHQYQKVAFSDNNNNNSGNYILFQHSVTGKFQELQILLERFVEDQSSCNDMHKRLSFQALLQVPDATGLMFIKEENKMMMEGEGVRASQVLEGINKCIEAFWLHIQSDENKSLSWVYKAIWRNNPPVEDPLDLDLLYNVTRTLHKKGIMLKDVEGKNKCWLRKKVRPLQTKDEKRNLQFAMIDMKLVQRLLKMCLVSTSHLNWCQQKLNNLDFKEGKVFRSCTSLLFPSS